MIRKLAFLFFVVCSFAVGTIACIYKSLEIMAGLSGFLLSTHIIFAIEKDDEI